MPNHIINIIEFQSPEVAAAFLADCKTEDRLFDFNVLIPMPESMDIESGTRTDRALIVYELFHGLPIDLFERYSFFDTAGRLRAQLLEEINEPTKENIIAWNGEQDEDYLALGEKAYLNYKNYGAKDWYDWRIKNWGTKWNAYEVEFDGDCRLSFQTAWNRPEPIFEALTRKYPDHTFTWTWADEDMGINCGAITRADGQHTIYQPDSNSHEAYELYVKCWGDSD